VVYVDPLVFTRIEQLTDELRQIGKDTLHNPAQSFPCNYKAVNTKYLFADEIKQVESTQSLAEAEAVHGAVAYHYKELREVLKNKKVPIISHALAMELANIIPEEELKGAIIVKEQKLRKIVKAGKKDTVKIISHEIARKAPITDIKDSIAVKESVLEELKKTKKRVKVLSGLPAYLIEGEDAIEHSLVANRVLKNAILISDDSDSPSKRRKNIW
jgi:hypothetical protein